MSPRKHELQKVQKILELSVMRCGEFQSETKIKERILIRASKISEM